MNTPDLTKAQLLAMVQAVIATAVAFGASLTMDQQTALLLLSGALATVLGLSDTAIRRGRAKVAEANIRLEETKAYMGNRVESESLTAPVGDANESA